jgi:peptidoglycan/LPS O-acetylase OafA/YrhL
LGTFRQNLYALILGYLICFAISVLLATLSRRYFEQIFLRKKKKFKTGTPDAVEQPPAETRLVAGEA